MNTLEEMIEKLKQLDEITVLELLNISSEELIDRCRDLIENDPERYNRELAQFFDEDIYDEEEISNT